MRSFCFFLLALVTLSSCLKEENAGLTKPETYVRYYNGGYEDEAVELLKTPDGGFIMLANSLIAGSDEGASPFYRVKLIKTDAYGNREWQQLFPSDLTDATVSLRAHGMNLRENGGYIIAGEDIQNSGTKFLVIETNAAGEQTQRAAVTLPSAEDEDPLTENEVITGLAIAEKNGAYFILGRIDAPVDNMIVASLNPSDLSLNWDKAYGSGDASLINKIFVDANNRMVWGGTVNRENDKTDMRLVRALPNSLNTEFDLPLGTPGFDEEANNMCRFGNGYAFIGNTSEPGNTDILFKRLAEDGSELSSLTFPVLINGVDAAQDETGNALAPTKDGGFILLGTFPTTVDLGRGGDDFYLIKIDAFGAVEWTQIMGSQNDDNGVAVLQTDDGGYLILGTTDLANVGTIALIKTDGQGNIK